MKLKCLYKGLWGNELTIGKEYEVIETFKRTARDTIYRIKLNDGSIYDFYLEDHFNKKWFEIVYDGEEKKRGEEEKSKLFIFTGSTATGKNTLLEQLANKGILKPLISATTRPKRVGGVEGREYHFIPEQEFDESIFAEVREYKVSNGETWYYGLTYEEIKGCCENVGNYGVILDVDGMKQIKKVIGDKAEVVTVMLQASYHSRIMRSLNRDNKDDKICKELCRRIIADSTEIEPFVNEYDIVVRSEDDDLERNIKIIKSLCE